MEKLKLNNFFWEELVYSWPKEKMFSQFLDDQYYTPQRRGSIYWDASTPKLYCGRDQNLKLFQGSGSRNPSYPIKHFSKSWQEFFELVLNTYTSYNKLYLNIIQDYADNIVYNLDTVKSMVDVENNITTVEPKFRHFPGLYEYNAPAMNIHQDSADKQFTQMFYFNRVWKDEWGGRLFFYNSHDAKDVNRIEHVDGNKSILFKVTDRSWHGVEGFSVPDKKYTRKSVMLCLI